MKRIGQIAALLATLAFCPLFLSWMSLSPTARYLDRFNSHVFSPPDGANDRLQYFRQLVIARGTNVEFATCILCSLRVEGYVSRNATTLWGDVEIAPTGLVSAAANSYGGRVVVLPGATPPRGEIEAIGGTIELESTLATNRHLDHTWPSYFYPGQRAMPGVGVLKFSGATLFIALFARWIVGRPRRHRVDAAVRRPVLCAVVGVGLMLLLYLALMAGMLLLYLIYPLAWLLLILLPIVLWTMIAIGLSALARACGRSMGLADGLVGQIAGAALLAGIMMVPIAGAFILIGVLFVSFGAGARVVLRDSAHGASGPATAAR